MVQFQVTDWDDAYANFPNIPNGNSWPEAWVEPAANFRAENRCEFDIAYGQHEREKYDLFLPPTGEPNGLFVFVHGGYWLALDKSYWSHLANGALKAGRAVMIPSYPLCPEVGIGDICQSIRQAVEHAAKRINGPIVLSGHSAGGHLVTALMCGVVGIDPNVRARIVHTLSISGLHDLRPLLKTQMNQKLQLNQETAKNLSPALDAPSGEGVFTAWVGGSERNEFRRQSDLLANIWHGLGARTQYIVEPDRHHFNVIDGLADPQSALMRHALQFG